MIIASFSNRDARHDNTGKLLPGTIGASAMQRQWIGLSISGDTVTIEPFPFPPSPVAPAFLQAVDLEIAFLRATQDSNTQYSVEELAKHFTRVYRDIMFSNEELIAFEFHGQNFRATVKSALVVELADEQHRGRVSERPPEYYTRGILMERTEINIMKSPNSTIKLKASNKKYIKHHLRIRTRRSFLFQGSSECNTIPQLQVRRYGYRWFGHRVQ